MGKNKHKNKGSHQNKSSSQNFVPKLSEQQLTDLVTQATQIHIFLNERHEKLKQAKDFVYILSTKWLREWKDYVGYEELFTDEKQSSKKRGKKRPGLPNSDLTTQNKSYLQIPQQLQQYQYLNVIIKEKMQKNDDYIAVTEELWTQFNQIYGPGTQIKRPFRVTKSKSVFIDGSLMKCDFIFLNYNQEDFISKLQHCKLSKNAIDQIIPYFNVQLSTIWEIKDLFTFFSKLCLVKFNSQKVTLWLCQNFLGTNTIQQNFIKSAKLKKYELFAQKLDPEDELYEDLDIDDFLKENYTIVVEIGDTKISTLQLPDDIFGYCEQCVEKKTLKYNCICQHKFYCSRQCQVDDQVFHFNFCQMAFVKNDDQIYNQKKVTDVSKTSRCGLKNLGNTCYMNSCLQTFIGLDFLVDFLSFNQYKGQISKKQKNAQMFLQNLSKFCKQMGQHKQIGSIEPWDIKGQINYFLTPFKGYKQHDAMDFFMGLIHTFNDCLQKSESQAFHSIIKDNIIGHFDSLVICPDCGNQIKNFECFTQLTLPIKTKSKKILYNYVLFDNPNTYKYGKAQVLQKWSQIKSDVGVDSDCIIFGGGDGQTGFTQIEIDSSPESFFKKFKKDLLFYPYQRLQYNQIIFSANYITTKVISGQNLRANFGYPFPIVADRSKTIGHFFIEIVRKINLDKNKEILQQLQIKYDQIKKSQKQLQDNTSQIQQNSVTTQLEEKKEGKQKEKKGNQKKDEKKDENKEQKKDQIRKQLQGLNSQITMILEQMSIVVYIEDTRKIKNICFFCKRKCDGCIFQPDFAASIEDSLGLKVNEARFFINVTPKIEPIKSKEDLAGSGESTLKDCITLFGQPEKLDQQNAWYCPKCQDMRLAFKQLHVSRFPNYLILQLSRFKNGANGKVKNNQPISYSEYETFGGKKYRLLSVIVHEGSIEGGHYWSICRRGQQFYLFNDDKVSKTDKICNKNAYILCYRAEQIEKPKGVSKNGQSRQKWLQNNKKEQ